MPDDEVGWPGLQHPGLYVAIIDGSEPSQRDCAMLGYVIYNSTPILVLALDGTPIPPKLRQVASEVIQLPEMSSERSRALVMQAIDRLTGGH